MSDKVLEKKYNKSEVDALINGRVSKNGDEIFDSLRIKRNNIDVTKADNGVEDIWGGGIQFKDKNDNNFAFLESYVRPDGSISLALGTINYNTSGQRVITDALMLSSKKDGSSYWNIHNASGLKAHINDSLPTFKYRHVTLGNVTLNAQGYLDIRSYTPTAPTGYTLLTTGVANWSSASPAVGFSLKWDASNIIGSANQTIINLIIRYTYILSNDIVSF